jgi:hypothetical protein
LLVTGPDLDRSGSDFKRASWGLAARVLRDDVWPTSPGARFADDGLVQAAALARQEDAPIVERLHPSDRSPGS